MDYDKAKMLELATDTMLNINVRYGAAIVLHLDYGMPVKELHFKGIAPSTLRHGIAGVRDDRSGIERMLTGVSSPSTEYYGGRHKQFEASPPARSFITRNEAPRSLATYQAEQLAGRDAEREHLRTQLSDAGGKVREREQRKADDSVVRLQVQLAGLNGAMLRVTPDDLANATPAARGQLFATLLETRQLALGLRQELKSLPANAGIPSEEG